MTTVDKIIEITNPAQIGFKGITLLSAEEVKNNYHNIKVIENTWWLCTNGELSNSAVVVHNDGYIYYPGYFYDSEIGVRPALVIKDLGEFEVGDQFILDEYRWTIINQHYALCDDIISKTCFKSLLTTRDKGFNDYSNSDIKLWLEDWFISHVDGVEWI